MNNLEMEYLQRAVAGLNSPYATAMTQHSLLKIIERISSRASQAIEQQVQEKFDETIARNYQDYQNQLLVDILSKNQ